MTIKTIDKMTDAQLDKLERLAGDAIKGKRGALSEFLAYRRELDCE